VAVIGLGTGAMAAYALKGELWDFYEIDPDIVRVARNSRYFTYLQDSPATLHVVLGDGRLSLAAAPAHRYDLLVVDAFNSDAIPVHLLTLEALSVYLSKLSENGILLFHLSNRYLDLEPVLSALIRENTARTRRLVQSGGAPSIWAAVTVHAASLGRLRHHPEWRPLKVRESVQPWTDDFSNVFSVFRWPGR
jgi:spermidine synthase